MNTRQEHVLLACTCTHIELPNVIFYISDLHLPNVFSHLQEIPEAGQFTFHISETAAVVAANKTTALCAQYKHWTN